MSEFAQGTIITTIFNERDSSFGIVCPSGQLDATPSFGITTKQIAVQSGEHVLVQILIDGRNYPFHMTAEFSSLGFKGAGRAARESMGALADALARGRQRNFVVEYPKYGKSESFSLLDARRILGTGRTGILEGC